MSLLFSRLHSTSTASAVASQFLAETQALPLRTHTQLLDANQLQRLSATLSRKELASEPPKNGTSLPPCWHLAYFTPAQQEADLGRDGSDTTFNPPAPFTRRMWAGGELEWVASEDKGLKIGQTVRETTKLLSAAGKKTKAGEEMVVVGVEKSFENEHGIALIDRRNWLFRPEITIPKDPAPMPEVVPFTSPTGAHTRDFCQTSETLFRFSALTFNGHKIHYNEKWCQEVEGHRGLVVHGPLNLINMVDFWRDVTGNAWPKKIAYRATSPLYAAEPYRMMLEQERDKISEVKILDSYGKVSMVGQIESV